MAISTSYRRRARRRLLAAARRARASVDRDDDGDEGGGRMIDLPILFFVVSSDVAIRRHRWCGPVTIDRSPNVLWQRVEL